MGPLEGILTVAVEQAVAAPFATRHLADMGARVVKVERPGGGDFARDYDETVRGMSSHFAWLNRSKESVVLDLKSESGRHAIRRLAEQADVFVHNLGPGRAEQLEISAPALRGVNQRLIHVSISGYGEGGPCTTKKAYDLLVQCEAAVPSVTGTPEAPSKVGIPVADIAAGMYAYSAVLAALIRRHATGQGATIEVSMLEALGEWMGFPAYYTMYSGSPPPRTGASHSAIAPYGPFRCRDGEVVFVAVQNEREWEVFCGSVLHAPEMQRDPRFYRNSSRVENRDELTRRIEAVFAAEGADSVLGRLDDAGIANARLRDVKEFLEHPQLKARGRWHNVDSPVGELSALKPAVVLDGDEPVMLPIPQLGEHTAAVLTEFGLEAESRNGGPGQNLTLRSPPVQANEGCPPC